MESFDCDCDFPPQKRQKSNNHSEIPPYYYSPPMQPLGPPPMYSHDRKSEENRCDYKNYDWEPVHIDMANYYTRLRTFAKWPKQMIPQGEELAQAGFFYRVEGDITTCFFCGVTVHNWENIDNAFFEHRKWSPCCKYINMIY